MTPSSAIAAGVTEEQWRCMAEMARGPKHRWYYSLHFHHDKITPAIAGGLIEVEPCQVGLITRRYRLTASGRALVLAEPEERK